MNLLGIGEISYSILYCDQSTVLELQSSSISILDPLLTYYVMCVLL